MKAVSADFLLAQASETQRRVREVYYKLRFWDSGEGKYVWSDTWRNVEKKATTVAAAADTVGLFELTDGTDTYVSSDVALKIGDQFGFDGLIEGSLYSGNRPSIFETDYYAIEVASPTISKRYSIQFYDDQISMNNSAFTYTDYLFDCTVYHEYKFEIKGDLTLDLYIDGVFATNMGAGYWPTAIPAAINFYPAGLGVLPSITRLWYQVVSEIVVDSETVTPEDRATSKVVSVSPIVWNLDTEQLTEFKVSNLSITVENFLNEWDQQNPDGHFGPSAEAADGYEPYWTKFQIRAGFQLADGSKEYVSLFTGMAVEFRRNGKDRNVQIDIQGQEAYMLNESAEDIATQVDNESAGVGDGVETEFLTANNGVGGVSEVQVAGSAVIEGEDYEVSQLNEIGLPAKITFTNAPDLAETVHIDYFYWPQNEEFNDLVELLVDGWLNSDPDNTIDIQPFVVANNVINSQEFTSKADWDSGALSAVDTDTFNGSLVIDWEDSAYRETVTWDTSLSGWTKYGSAATDVTIYNTGGNDYLRFSAIGGAQRNAYIDRSFSRLTGSWEFKATFPNAASGSLLVSILNVKLFNEMGVAGFGTDFWISRTHPCRFYGQTFANPDNNEHTYLITRTASGVMRLYIDGSLTCTATYVTDSALAFGFQSSLRTNAVSPFTVDILVRDLSVPTASAVANWVSPVIDWTTTPFGWGPLIRSIDLDRNGERAGSSILFETDSSADNFATSDGFVAMSASDTVPNSIVRRYLKVRLTLTTNQTMSPEPVVNAFTVQAYSSSIPVLLPALSGQNVHESIGALAAFANYEWGITSDQVFFFRPKSTVGDPVMALAQNDFIEEITDLQNGYENIYSKVEITYGPYVKRIEARDDIADSPATRFLKKTFELAADANIQIAPSADIATAMSRDYFNRLYILRKRFKARTRFLPQLEVSDLVSFSFGFDPSGTQRKLLDALPGKIIGARYDTERYTCEFDVEEVAF